MATAKRYQVSDPGPVNLAVRLTAGEVLIKAEDGARAEIVVQTTDDSGPSADAVNRARFSETGGEVRVEVPTPNGGVVNSVIAGNVYGGVTVVNGQVFSGGVTVVNGRVVSGGGAVVGGSSPIYIAALVPTNSSVKLDTTSADARTHGRLAHVQAQSVSGDVEIAAAASADIRTTSGDVEIQSLAGDSSLQSVSGDIRVHAVVPCRVGAQTVSGDVTVTGARVDLDARSVSGRVRQR